MDIEEECDFTNDDEFIHAASVLGGKPLDEQSRDDLIKVARQCFINMKCSEEAREYVFKENQMLHDQLQKDRKIEELETSTHKLQDINKKMRDIKERLFQLNNYDKQQISPTLWTKAAQLNTVLDNVQYHMLDLAFVSIPSVKR